VPAGKALVTCNIGCEEGGPHWEASDEEVGHECATGLHRIVHGALQRCLGARVMHTALPYPIFKGEYEKEQIQYPEA
jgi:hypothetical protein